MSGDLIFWMVWNPMGRAPTFKHRTKGGAQLEAERLARLNRGETFFVLEAVSMSKAVDVETTTLRMEIPF